MKGPRSTAGLRSKRRIRISNTRHLSRSTCHFEVKPCVDQGQMMSILPKTSET